MNHRSKSFIQRVTESNKIRQQYPDKVPIIVEKSRNIRSDIPDINKNKYLVPRTISFGQFVFVIRRQLELSPDKALFMFINNALIPSSVMMGDIYNTYVEPDGFVYAVYTSESVFG